MKTNMLTRTLSLALSILLCVTPLISCNSNKGNTDKGGAEIHLSDKYVITRPEKASEMVKSCAKELRTAYQEQGLELEIKDDWAKSESDIPELEILLGDTSRPESARLKESFGENTAWKIGVDGKKLVIAADSDRALANAVSELVTKLIKKGEGINIMSTFTLSADKSGENTPIEFLWKDGEESVIKSGSWGPRVYTLSNGTVIAGYETSSGIRTSTSTDGAKSFKKEASASFYPSLACANVNLFEHEGKVYLAYRATGAVENGFYTSLQLSVSENGGKSWEKHSTIAEYTQADGAFRGVWEPYLGLLNGKLTCFYANDSSSVTPMQNIEYLVWNGTSWGERTVVSEGTAHNSRDGMPVWTRLSSGEYVCVIESSSARDSGHPFVIQILYSRDGKKWSIPVTVYTPTTNGSKAGAPGIVELPSGQLVISFQTDEDATQKGDGTSVMKTITSDGTEIKKLKAKNFTKSDNVFGTPDGEGSVWTGIWYCDGWLYAAAGTSKGSSLKKIELY